MKKGTILFALLASTQLSANNQWFVVDTTASGEAPFYLKSNSEYSMSWDGNVQKAKVKEKLVNKHILPNGANKLSSIKESAKGLFAESEKSEAVGLTPRINKPVSSPVEMYILADPITQRERIISEESTKRLSVLPVYRTDNKGTDSSTLDKYTNDFQKTNVISIVKEAILPDAEIPKSKAGVPQFSLTKKITKVLKNKKGKKYKKQVKIKVKDIPALNIGRPEEISNEDFLVPELEVLTAKLSKLKPLVSPSTVKAKTVQKLLKMKVSKVRDNRKFDLKELIKADVLVKKINETGFVVTKNIEMNIKNIHKIHTEEMQFLQAEILYSKGDQCHSATGIYYRLLNAKNPNYRSVAKLKVGICAHKMGLFTESVRRLLSVLIENNEEAKREALAALLSDLPLNHQNEIGDHLVRFTEYHLIKAEHKDSFNYVIAKSLASKAKYSSAIKYAEQVKDSSDYYTRAQYIASVGEYLLGKKEMAFKRQEKIASYIQKKGDKKDSVSSLVAISKARMNFQRRKYKDSIAEFLKIDRNHPMWIEGLQQQAWAQMMVKDEPGAIGNMHSIHTPFFRSVYKPESFVIRGLGYINLCQFADAYKSVKNLEYTYKPEFLSLKKFNKKNSKNVFNYYKMAASYLLNPKQKKISGVNTRSIREAVRHKDFLNLQDAINTTYDEGEQYRFLVSLIEKDRRSFIKLRTKAKKRKKSLKAKIVSIKANKKLRKHESQWKLQVGVEDFLISYYDFRIANFKYSKKGMKKFSKDSSKNLRNRRNALKMVAGKVLKKRFSKMESSLSQMLQNNELLKYEIFAGAGDNLRYRITGGKTVGKSKATTSELKKESLNWEFDGEFWEDEVGHYRSSLKNVCAESTATASR